MSKAALIKFIQSDRFAYLLICFLGICSYFTAFGHDFQTLWDDQWVAINSYTAEGVTYSNLYRIISEFYRGQYAPVNQLYYSTLYYIFGYNAFAFHAGSVFFHIFNAILVYLFIKRLSTVLKLSVDTTHLISLVTAVLFVVHPVAVESVAWIAASKVAIYAFFYLAGLLSYLNYLNNKSWLSFVLVIVLFLLSFGAKEQAVTLPVCLVLIDYLYQRDFRNKQVYFEKIPFFVLAIILGYVTMLSQQAYDEGVLSHKAQYPFYQRIVFANYAVIEYLTKCLIPIKLSYIYPFPIQIGEKLPIRFWIYPAINGVLLLLVYVNFRNRILIFWSSFFLLHLAVALHIIPIGRFTITADRYVYISLIAVCFGLTYLIICLWKFKSRYKYLLLSVYGFILFVYSIQRVRVWKNSDTLKRDMREILKNREESNSVNNNNQIF
ncbi:MULTISPECIES: hypothetical protein [Sphingobacterium]|uniref:hypothetical protein n=1 Tax=Sphingobacterium TaxID=28453 RepID=UPI000DF9704B|nr:MULTISPECIES: hypothetical protein [Sphingobacterium]QQT43557.1 hypothetical protein I6J00_17625 [Sphingobacterium multivorum]SUI97945.1 Uncharacterised protein [Sphingobacterium multivorum]